MQKSAKLIDDAAFISAHAAMSQKPFEYYTAFPPALPVKTFPRACTSYAGGCKQKYVTGEIIEESNRLYAPPPTRPNPRPNTELFGTAPFKARGDGLLRHTDVYSSLVSSGFNPHCSKTLSEVDYDRFECINAPLQVENEELTGFRGGAPTRVGPAYYAC